MGVRVGRVGEPFRAGPSSAPRLMWHHKETKKPQPGSNDRGWKQQTGVSVLGGGLCLDRHNWFQVPRGSSRSRSGGNNSVRQRLNILHEVAIKAARRLAGMRPPVQPLSCCCQDACLSTSGRTRTLVCPRQSGRSLKRRRVPDSTSEDVHSEDRRTRRLTTGAALAPLLAGCSTTAHMPEPSVQDVIQDI